MRRISTRDLRNTPGKVRELLEEEDLLLTASGEPVAYMIGMGDENPEEMADMVRRARAQRALLARSRFGFDPDDVEALLEHLRSVGERLTAPPLAVTLPDEDDLPFLELAACGGARALVTGNGADFEPRSGSHSVPVVSPDAFLEEVLDI